MGTTTTMTTTTMTTSTTTTTTTMTTTTTIIATTTTEARPPRCWVVMPTGCRRRLSETETPQQWFVDPGSRDARRCSDRLAAFNRHCGRSNGKTQWGSKPSPAEIHQRVPQCWVVMPTGCSRGLSETRTPRQWFVDPFSGNAGRCSSRLSDFNRHCGRSDGKSQWGYKPETEAETEEPGPTTTTTMPTTT